MSTRTSLNEHFSVIHCHTFYWKPGVKESIQVLKQYTQITVTICKSLVLKKWFFLAPGKIL